MKSRFPLALLPAIFLSACSSSMSPPDLLPEAAQPKPGKTDSEVIPGNSPHGNRAVDLKKLLADAAPRAEVLAELGGTASEITGLSQLDDLTHSESSTYSHQDSLEEIDALFLASKETYLVMVDGGNDILLFFNKRGLLADYYHL